MARLTIGVPVHNEAEFLAGSLEELRTQPFADIEVLVFDNASTDATADVARDFVARDSRFHYFRQPENKGALRNFQDVLAAAKSPYFMWKACDDRSDPDFILKLVALLDQTPDADLAVGRVVSSRIGRDRTRETRFNAFPRPIGGFERLRLLFHAHASWIYGLFRREQLLARMREVEPAYANEWAWDHVMLFAFLFDGRVVGTNETAFRQIIKPTRPRISRARRAADLDKLADLRRLFFTRIRADVAVRAPGIIARAPWNCILWLLVGKRVYRWRKLTRSRIKLALGVSGHR